MARRARNSDDDRRKLERLAAMGDEQAAMRLAGVVSRTGGLSAQVKALEERIVAFQHIAATTLERANRRRARGVAGQLGIAEADLTAQRTPSFTPEARRGSLERIAIRAQHSVQRVGSTIDVDVFQTWPWGNARRTGGLLGVHVVIVSLPSPDVGGYTTIGIRVGLANASMADTWPELNGKQIGEWAMEPAFLEPVPGVYWLHDRVRVVSPVVAALFEHRRRVNT